MRYPISFFCLAAFSLAAAEIKIEILAPAAGLALSDSTLAVSVRVTSTYDVKAVNAKVDGQERDLTFSAPLFGVHLPLAGVSKGDKNLIIKVVDVVGNTASAEREFRYLDATILAVERPEDLGTADPFLPVAASCKHDASTGCTVSVSWRSGNGPYTEPIARQDRIDTIFDFRSVTWHEGTLRYTACDGYKRCQTVERGFYVLNSPYLTPWQRFPREIWDFHYGQIVYGDIHAGESGYPPRSIAQIHVWDSLDGKTRTPGRGIPPETIFGSGSARRTFAVFPTPGRKTILGSGWWDKYGPRQIRFYEESPTSLTPFPIYYVNYEKQYQVRGDFLMLMANFKIYRKSIESDRIDSVNVHPLMRMATLDEEGTLYFHENDSLFAYPFTGPKRAVHAGTISECGVRSDRGRVLLTCGTSNREFRYDSKTGSFAPEGTAGGQMPAGSDFVLSGEWTAFTRPGNLGQNHVWALAPDGTEYQASLFGTSSSLETLAANGELTFVNGATRYWWAPGGSPVAIGWAKGRSHWSEGQWFLAVGSTLYKMHPRTPVGVATAPQAARGGTAPRLAFARGGRIAPIRIDAGKGGSFEIDLTDLRGRVRSRFRSGPLGPGMHYLAPSSPGPGDGVYPVRIRRISDPR